MYYIFLPKEFVEPLKVAGISVDNSNGFDELTNLSKLSGILSPDDVAYYYSIHSTRDKSPLPYSIVESFDPWVNENTLANISDSSLKDRIRDFEIRRTEGEGETITEEHLMCVLLNEQCILFTNSDVAIDGSELYERVISVLRGVLSISEIADMPLFTTYIERKQQR